jgi:hypothetical protein
LFLNVSIDPSWTNFMLETRNMMTQIICDIIQEQLNHKWKMHCSVLRNGI